MNMNINFRLVILFLMFLSFVSMAIIFLKYKDGDCVDKLVTTDNRIFYGRTSYSGGLVSIYGKDGVIRVSSTLVKEISKECK